MKPSRNIIRSSVISAVALIAGTGCATSQLADYRANVGSVVKPAQTRDTSISMAFGLDEWRGTSLASANNNRDDAHR
ncbi:MAG TPA: hypothetical protein VG711_12235 [Phycisphaerales bacterium]|nr:hypothetical protein [Phycisphaerales bacterium]